MNEPDALQLEDRGPVEEHAANHSVGPGIRLEKKHPLAIRWMHWINFPVLFIMMWTGLLIYWNDSDNAYQYPHRVYRIGLGRFTLFRMFPDWFYKMLHVPYHVTEGLGFHFLFMWFFLLNGHRVGAVLRGFRANGASCCRNARACATPSR